MKKIYIKSIVFWFILLFLAITNASVREMFYKPILSPYIGMWAHQISSLTGILMFFVAIYFFIKNNFKLCNKKKLIFCGLIWFTITIVFETLMNIFIRNLNFKQVLQTYYFWQGETWIFVLLSLLVSPFVTYKLIEKKR